MVRTEGKKQQGEVYAKEAPTYKCPICKGNLVKLETETGEPYSIVVGVTRKVYYDLYWICLCPNGHGKFKVKDTTFKMYMDGK